MLVEFRPTFTQPPPYESTVVCVIYPAVACAPLPVRTQLRWALDMFGHSGHSWRVGF